MRKTIIALTLAILSTAAFAQSANLDEGRETCNRQLATRLEGGQYTPAEMTRIKQMTWTTMTQARLEALFRTVEIMNKTLESYQTTLDTREQSLARLQGTADKKAIAEAQHKVDDSKVAVNNFANQMQLAMVVLETAQCHLDINNMSEPTSNSQ